MYATLLPNSQIPPDVVSYVSANQMPTGKPPSLLTVEEMAAMLRIGRNSAYQLVKQGRIPSIRIGRTIRIPLSSIYSFIHGATDIR